MENGSNEGMGAGLTFKGLKTGPNPSGKEGVLVLNKSNPTGPNLKQWIKCLKCSHYGNSKHTRDTCFKLHGYPDWWQKLQAKKKCNDTNIEPNTSKMTVATTEPQLSPIPTDSTNNTLGITSLGSTRNNECNLWILDFRATDHMTFDAQDFCQHTAPRRISIANANGTVSSVQGAGTMVLSPALLLSNTLFVPSLSHKLLSVSPLTKDLNCTVLMYHYFYLIQYILTKEMSKHS